MKSQLRSILTILTLALFFVSCKDENSIQTYFVDHKEQAEFFIIRFICKDDRSV